MILSALIYLLTAHSVAQFVELPAGPGPLDNPLKGFASYCEPGTPLTAPVSMAFEETSWKALEPAEGQYAFDNWEAKSWNLGPAAGKQVALRVFLDYPHQAVAVPQWIIDSGVKMTKYDEFGGGLSPDYSDPKLLKPLFQFIKAFGKRYDHDHRVAYIQVGLLGHWGEWHTYPHEDLFASPKVQSEVIQAMHEAFPDKPMMARNASYASCQVPWLGFHDDMIPEDTFGKDDWEFLPAIQKGGVAANWKVAPTGGEMVPGAAAQYLGKDWDLLQRSVKEAHFTWIGPYCPAMKQNPTALERSRTEELIRSLGYQFRLTSASVAASVRRGGSVSFEVKAVNEGVAPMYVGWKPTFALIDKSGAIVQRFVSGEDPRQWLPGPFSVRAFGGVSAPAGSYKVGLGIVDPSSGKAKIRFANTLPESGGYTVVGSLEVTD